MIEHMRGIPMVEVAPESPYDRMIQRLAFLAPDLQSDIMAGRQPAGFSLERLKKIEVPIAWSEKRRALGWNATG